MFARRPQNQTRHSSSAAPPQQPGVQPPPHATPIHEAGAIPVPVTMQSAEAQVIMPTAPPPTAHGAGRSRPAPPGVSRPGRRADAPMSVIGSDLSILGGGLRIVSQGNLTVDGKVQGDVLGANVIIGKHGKVDGLVHGDSVVIEGAAKGTIRALNVHLTQNAVVEADIHHQSLVLDMGASFEGTSRREGDETRLIPDLEAAARENPEG